MHIPVLLKEVLKALRCQVPGIYVDCTVGAGGHTRAILAASPGNRVIGIDRDEEVLRIAKENLKEFGDRITLIHDNFVNIDSILHGMGIRKVDGILFDLGVSSIQLESPERGFSFQKEGPLDMRMDKRESTTAADLVNHLSRKDLEDLFYKYGEERWARRIAMVIVRERNRHPITTTKDLVDIVMKAVPEPYKHRKIHPATKVFQALRIAVNKELDDLKEALIKAISLLKKGGRLCVISFHSLEDRIVKHTFKDLAKGCICPPHVPFCVCGRKKMVSILTPKPIIPQPEEIQLNPRARSAKMRCLEKIEDNNREV